MKVIITKHMVSNKVNYQVKYDNVSIWCKSYEIGNYNVWLYYEPDCMDYIGRISINKSDVVEKY